MVVRKLASSLVAIFRNTACSWKRAIWQVAASLAHGGYITEEQSLTVDLVQGLLPALTTQKATALTFFSVALAEEASRLEAEPQDLVGTVIPRIVENINDAFSLVRYTLQQIAQHATGSDSASSETNLGIEAIGSWKVGLPSFIRIITLLNTHFLSENRHGLVFMVLTFIPLTNKLKNWLFRVGKE